MTFYKYLINKLYEPITRFSFKLLNLSKASISVILDNINNTKSELGIFKKNCKSIYDYCLLNFVHCLYS